MTRGSRRRDVQSRKWTCSPSPSQGCALTLAEHGHLSPHTSRLALSCPLFRKGEWLQASHARGLSLMKPNFGSDRNQSPGQGEGRDRPRAVRNSGPRHTPLVHGGPGSWGAGPPAEPAAPDATLTPGLASNHLSPPLASAAVYSEPPAQCHCPQDRSCLTQPGTWPCQPST